MDSFWFIAGCISTVAFISTMAASILHAVGTHTIHQNWEAAAIYSFISMGLLVFTAAAFTTAANALVNRR